MTSILLLHVYVSRPASADPVNRLPLTPYPLKIRVIVRYCDGLRYGFEFLYPDRSAAGDGSPGLRDTGRESVEAVAESSS